MYGFVSILGFMGLFYGFVSTLGFMGLCMGLFLVLGVGGQLEYRFGTAFCLPFKYSKIPNSKPNP